MEPTTIIESDPLWESIEIQARGLECAKASLNSFALYPWAFAKRASERRVKTVLSTPLACMLPLWTSSREVSGRNDVRATRSERMARNQKIHLQPSFSAIIPARTGLKLGAAHAWTSER